MENNEELKQRIDELELELAHEKELNNNLIRIMRERANAKRGLRPKKQHSGYILISATQQTRTIRIENDRIQWLKENPNAKESEFQRYSQQTTTKWKTTIQTPYDSSLPFESVHERIFEELNFLLQKTNKQLNNSISISFSADFTQKLWKVIILSDFQIVFC